MHGAELPANPARPLWEDRYWTGRDGLRLHYRDYPGAGDRPPILCLHGLTRNARDFDSLAARHAGGWRVLVPDFRGRGLSERDPRAERYAPPTYAQDVLELLDRLDIPRAIFLGTSLGGIVTMLVAATAPERIAAAMLNDIGPDIDPAGIERIGTYVGRPVQFADFGDAAARIGAKNADVHPGYGPADWLRFAHRVCRQVEDGVVFDYDMAIAENFHSANSDDPADAWPAYRALATVPVLILRGEGSDLLSPRTAEAMRDALPDAELVTVRRVGHAPDLDEPQAVAAIDRLLARALQASS